MTKAMKARHGGFTLVELLIVIIIIAILAGMLLLATGSATDSADATKIINDIRNLKGAAMMYYVDNNAWPADGDGTTVNFQTGVTNAADVEGSMDIYLDRGFFSSGLYNLAFATYNDNATTPATPRTLIGYTFATAPQSGVLNKLESKAVTSGILNNTGGNFAAGDIANGVFMNMK